MKIFAVKICTQICLLALGLAACHEYRGPYSKADAEEYLTGKYPDKVIHIRQNGLQSWECWFEECPEAVFQSTVGWGGGDPVSMLYSKLVSDEKEIIPAYYMRQYQKEADRLGVWNLSNGFLSAGYSSMAEAVRAFNELSAFFVWVKGKPLAELLPKGHYQFQPELPWRSYSPEFHSFEVVVVHKMQDRAEAVLEELEGTIKKYYAFYALPCADFSQKELEEYALKTWPRAPKPIVRKWKDGEPVISWLIERLGKDKVERGLDKASIVR